MNIIAASAALAAFQRKPADKALADNLENKNAGPKSGKNELITRILAAVILAPLVLAAVYLGGFVFVVLIGIMAALIVWEWMRLVFGHKNLSPAGFAVLMMLGLVYAILPAVALFLLRLDPVFGLSAVLMVLFIVWACDSAAYFTGRAIGGPKLAPSISPGKTWSGFFGGVSAGGFIGAIGAFYIVGAEPLILAGVAALLAAISQGGDLFESAVKRFFGVKDASNLIPGHGGMMDRVDGLIAAAFTACGIGIVHLGWQRVGEGLLIW